MWRPLLLLLLLRAAAARAETLVAGATVTAEVSGSAWTVDGTAGSPDLVLVRGQAYTFTVTGGHSLQLWGVYMPGDWGDEWPGASATSSGGTLAVPVSRTAPSVVAYRSSSNWAINGTLRVVDRVVTVTDASPGYAIAGLSGANPDLTLHHGDEVAFAVDVTGQSFLIKTSPTTGQALFFF